MVGRHVKQSGIHIGHLKQAKSQPFNAPFTQGMIIRGMYHTQDESDKNAKPVYHLPEEVEEGRLIATGEPVETVPSAKMSKSKKRC